jgi:pimeloyl-ACP methyl ester carboxylesterase
MTLFDAAPPRPLRELAVPPQRIILAGRSLGSAVAVELATRVPSERAASLQRHRFGAGRFATLLLGAGGLLASQRFDSLAKAPRVAVPVLQVHSSNDWLVPLEDARAMFEKCPGRKAMLELPGRHNDVGIAGDALARALAEFWPSRERVGRSRGCV